jgi:hypothetical protein
MKKVFTHMLIPKKSDGVLPQLGGMCLFLFISFLVHAQEWAVSGALKDEGACLIIKEIKLNQNIIL